MRRSGNSSFARIRFRRIPHFNIFCKPWLSPGNPGARKPSNSKPVWGIHIGIPYDYHTKLQKQIASTYLKMKTRYITLQSLCCIRRKARKLVIQANKEFALDIAMVKPSALRAMHTLLTAKGMLASSFCWYNAKKLCLDFRLLSPVYECCARDREQWTCWASLARSARCTHF